MSPPPIVADTSLYSPQVANGTRGARAKASAVTATTLPPFHTYCQYAHHQHCYRALPAGWLHCPLRVTSTPLLTGMAYSTCYRSLRYDIVAFFFFTSPFFLRLASSLLLDIVRYVAPSSTSALSARRFKEALEQALYTCLRFTTFAAFFHWFSYSVRPRPLPRYFALSFFIVHAASRVA